MDKKILVIGYGNQAKVWCQNLKDSGWDVTVTFRKNGQSFKNFDYKFNYLPLEDHIFTQPYCALLIPDHEHEKFFSKYKNHFHKDSVFIFAHAYSLTQMKNIDFNYALLAPKCIAREMRTLYLNKGKFGGVFSCSKDHESDILQLSKDLGITIGPFKTSLLNETKADLFSEQALLCSVIPYVALECFNILKEDGVEKELAFLECWHELKTIIDTMVSLGPSKFFEKISPNALIGSQKGQKLLINESFKENLKTLYREIKDQTFYKEINHTNIEELKNNVRSFWNFQDLAKTKKELMGE